MRRPCARLRSLGGADLDIRHPRVDQPTATLIDARRGVKPATGAPGVVRVACLGGCHCQYVGQDRVDPANRYDIARGFCESYRAAMTGMVRAGVGASLDQSDGSTRTVYTHAIKRIDRDTRSRFDA
jgi:hypothetical protein